MKNPYLRKVLIISIALSILFTIASIVGQWAESYSISNYGSSTLTSFSETPNPYENISRVLNYVELVMIAPLYISFFVVDPYFAGSLLEVAGPVIVFIAWFVILYVVTYLYAKFIKKNLAQENKKYRLLLIICILIAIALSAGQVFYIYEQEISFIPKSVTLNSISPSTASDGQYITLNGSGFSGQSIGVVVWLYDPQKNVYGFLWSGQPTNDKTFQIQLKTTGLCDNALQNPCHDALENFGSGQYEIQIRGGANTPSVPIEIVASTTGVTFTGTTSASQEINGTVSPQNYNLPINYLDLSTETSMMKQNTGIDTDANINDTNFQTIDQAGKQETLYLMSFDQYVSTDDAQKVIGELGYRPANIDEFLSFVWNEYETLQKVRVSTATISKVPINGAYEIPIFQWANGVPEVTLRSAAAYQQANEYSLVVKE